MLHWLVSGVLLAAALIVYYSLFVMPYHGITLKGCPSVCSYTSDCSVPGCGTARNTSTQIRNSDDFQANRKQAQVRCYRGKCQLSGGHKHFFGAATVFILLLLGLGAVGITIFKAKMRLDVNEEGIHFYRLHTELHIPWESFLGVTYHGVNTRTGQEATVYSISGDTGIMSFMVPGLPEGTTTRELELGSFFFLQLSREERDQLITLLKDKTDAEPEPEYEW